MSFIGAKNIDGQKYRPKYKYFGAKKAIAKTLCRWLTKI